MVHSNLTWYQYGVDRKQIFTLTIFLQIADCLTVATVLRLPYKAVIVLKKQTEIHRLPRCLDDDGNSSFILHPGAFCHVLERKKWRLRSWYHTLQWCHNDHDIVSNHQPHGCLLNRLFRRRSKKTSKLRVTGLCVGNSPAQRASYADNVSIWWRHHELCT